MKETLYNYFPIELIQFLLVAVFSLLIGLSQRKLKLRTEETTFFGSDRTFTLIGILGYILYIFNKESMIYWAGGGILLSVFLGLNYFFKMSHTKSYGLTSVMITFITYCLAPLIITQPSWFYLSVVVTVLLVTEMQETFIHFAKKMNNDEFVTLAKFLIIGGIILPILPDTQLIANINITPRKIWLAVVIISTISYASYLLKKFVFRESGIVISGLLGGLYSSTATTLILARKSKTAENGFKHYTAAIVLATSMMYLRILILILIFNAELFNAIWWVMLIMFAVSLFTGLSFGYEKGKGFFKQDPNNPITLTDDKNPLEFRVAMLFAFLFVAFTFITYYTIMYFGGGGLNVLSFIVGFTDIDPFLINLFQGSYSIPVLAIATATLQAIISNNILKLCYSVSLGHKAIRRNLFLSFGIIISANILVLAVIFFLQ